jgi:predicted nucleotidyltransferase
VGVLVSKEPDGDRARRIAEDGCVLRSLVGSTVHGLSNPGTDDRDEMGVCVEPREYVLGLRKFEHFVFRTQPEGHPSGPGDLDLTIYGLRKWCRLAMRGSPTVLLLLYVGGDHVLVREPIGDELQRLAPAFVSQRTGKAFLGYLSSQRQAFENERPRTREQSSTHGYDTKYAMHALRIAHQGLELMTTGRITLPVAEPHRSRLMAVRHGEPTPAQIRAMMDTAEADLVRAVEATRVPVEADTRAIDAFLVSAYERAWADAEG